MNVLANELAISFPPNIKTLIELPGKKESIEIFIPEKTDTYNFFNKTGMYSKEYEKKAYFSSLNKYSELTPYVESIKPVESGSILKLNIAKSAYNDFNITNEKGSYNVSYDYSYGYVIKVKLDIIVQSEYEFDYANGNLKENEENITRTQKSYVKEKFRTELLALGYEEDTPFFSFLAKENSNRRIYVKDKSIIKVLDEGYESKYMNAITVYFENKDINDNLKTIQDIKNDEKFKELQTIFK
jgi:hypothetical protein